MPRDGGKGIAPRPLSVPMDKFDTNFEAIFGKKTKLPQPQMKEEKQNEMDSNSSDSNR